MGRYCRLLQENGRLRVLHKGPVPPSWIQRESQGSRKVLQGYRRLEPILEGNAGANIHGRFKRVIMHIASPFLPPSCFLFALCSSLFLVLFSVLFSILKAGSRNDLGRPVKSFLCCGQPNGGRGGGAYTGS